MKTMTFLYVLSGIIVVCLSGYLLTAILWPEKF